MNKSQTPSGQSTSQTRALFKPKELSALTGIGMGAIHNAVTKGNRYFRAWMRSEVGTWDFEVLDPNSKRPRRRFYRVD